MINDIQYMQDMRDGSFSLYKKSKISALEFANLVTSIGLPNPFPINWVHEITKQRKENGRI